MSQPIIDVRLEPKSEKQFRRMLKDWTKAKGGDINTAIKDLAQSSAYGLMRKTVPFGSAQSQGNKFIQAIFWQVLTAGLRREGSLPDAHASQRNTRGRVTGKRYYVKNNALTHHTDANTAYIKKKMANAGMLKAAWIVASEKIPGYKGKRKLPQWVKRHISKASYGSARTTGRGFSTDVDLTNELTYSNNKNTNINQGLREGYMGIIKQVKDRIEGTGRFKNRGNKMI